MTTEEIITATKQKGYRGKRYIYSMWEALVYLLYKRGYLRKYIADALHTSPDNITYAIEVSRNHIDVADDKFNMMYDELLKHTISMCPRFEISQDSSTMNIRTTLYIDNIKY